MTAEAPENSAIDYTFSFGDGHEWQHKVDLLATDSAAGTAGAEETPEWVRLGFHQCAHCPLTPEESPNCPYAMALARPVEQLSHRASHEHVAMTVNWRGREVRQTTTLQRAAGSLLGALGAVSGCPYTRKLKAMAWFHQPFSLPDESLYRVLGTYLLGQHLRQKRGLEADWDLKDLRKTYKDLRQVNKGMSARLTSAAEQDSSLNGLVLLDLLAADTLYSLDRYAGELDEFFEAYFD